MEISTIAMMGIAGVCLLAGKTLAWKKGGCGDHSYAQAGRGLATKPNV